MKVVEALGARPQLTGAGSHGGSPDGDGDASERLIDGLVAGAS